MKITFPCGATAELSKISPACMAVVINNDTGSGNTILLAEPDLPHSSRRVAAVELRFNVGSIDTIISALQEAKRQLLTLC